MSILPLVSLLVYVCSALSFSVLCLFELRTWRTAKPDSSVVVRAALTAASALWSGLCVAVVLAGPFSGRPLDPHLVEFGQLLTGYLFPPLIMQVYYLENRFFLAKRRWWKLPIAFVWIASAVSMALLSAMEFTSLPLHRRIAGTFSFSVVLLALVALAVTFSALTKLQAPSDDARARKRRVAYSLLLGFMLLLVVISLAVPSVDALGREEFITLIGGSMTLCFLKFGPLAESRSPQRTQPELSYRLRSGWQRWSIISLALGLVIAVVFTLPRWRQPTMARECRQQTPLPTDVHLIAPGADVPEAMARFAGAWAGAWRPNPWALRLPCCGWLRNTATRSSS